MMMRNEKVGESWRKLKFICCNIKRKYVILHLKAEEICSKRRDYPIKRNI